MVNLQKIYRLSEEAEGFVLAFILEPLKSILPAHQENLALRRQLAGEHRIYCLDMPRSVQDFEDGGLLYWDFVHFTDYGHRVFAGILESETRDTVDYLISSFSKQETHTFIPKERR